jgi:hypothetical protein
MWLGKEGNEKGIKKLKLEKIKKLKLEKIKRRKIQRRALEA